MEELLIAIFQMTFEIILQILIQFPWEFGLSFSERRATDMDRDPNYVIWIFGSLLMGGVDRRHLLTRFFPHFDNSQLGQNYLPFPSTSPFGISLLFFGQK